MPRRTDSVKKAIRLVEDNGLKVYRPRHKDNEFVKLYAEALQSLLPKISPTALKVYLALVFEMDWQNPTVSMTKAEIMEATALSEKPVRNALNELENLGLLTRIGPPSQRKYVLSNMYIRKGKKQN